MPDSIANIRRDILDFCFDRYDGTFAGGQEANNKLDLERIGHLPHLAAQIVSRLAEIIETFEPDLLVSTPKGADWLTVRTSWRLGTSALLLDKDPSTKEFAYRPTGRETVEKSQRLVIVDDALNRLTNTGKVFDLPGIADKAVAIGAIWDRNPGRETDLSLPIGAVISEEIPDMLPDDSPLWEHAH